MGLRFTPPIRFSRSATTRMNARSPLPAGGFFGEEVQVDGRDEPSGVDAIRRLAWLPGNPGWDSWGLAGLALRRASEASDGAPSVAASRQRAA
jgi:hypothetical protein